MSLKEKQGMERKEKKETKKEETNKRERGRKKKRRPRQHELHLGAPPVLKYCTSCRHYRDAYFAFTIGRKTCRDCCEKHRVYQAEKRKAEKKKYAQTGDNPRDTRSPKESVSKEQTF